MKIVYSLLRLYFEMNKTLTKNKRTRAMLSFNSLDEDKIGDKCGDKKGDKIGVIKAP